MKQNNKIMLFLSLLLIPFSVLSYIPLLSNMKSSKKIALSKGDLFPDKTSNTASRFRDEAAKIRQEVVELEIALREEARSKGVPEEMINKLIPITVSKSTTKKTEKKHIGLLSKDIRSKLGYLNTGDAIRITSELDRIKENNIITKWNSKNLLEPYFEINNYQLKGKTNIDPVNLKLDDVGFVYQNVFIAAIVIGSVCGLSANFIGGQIGFLFGYISVLFPIILVGIGSIAPGIIGEVLYKFKLTTNEETRKRHVIKNAGKFLAGYVAGLPVARFNQGSPSNTVEFFQLRPRGKSIIEDKLMFAKSKFTQTDIARISIVCLASSVAECIEFGIASGTNPGDVSLLNELINSIEPPIKQEQVQNHIRWSALTAWEILNQYKEEYQRLVVAFEKEQSLEECISIIEGEDGL
jgi:hypothetical protein